MKKKNRNKNKNKEDELRPEYDFSKLKILGRGIHAAKFKDGIKIVLLPPKRAKHHSRKAA